MKILYFLFFKAKNYFFDFFVIKYVMFYVLRSKSHFCCKMRINVTQIKVEMTMYYFNNIYIEGVKKSKKINIERMRGR